MSGDGLSLAKGGTLWAVSWFGDFATGIKERECLSPIGGSVVTYSKTNKVFMEMQQDAQQISIEASSFAEEQIQRGSLILGSGVKDNSKWSAWFVWLVTP